MKQSDWALTIVVGSLVARRRDGQVPPPLAAWIEASVRQSGRLSFGFRDAVGGERAFGDWLRAQSPETDLRVILDHQADHELPDHILHAFQGGRVPVLQASKGHFALIAEQAPTLSLGPRQWVQLLDAQPQASRIWQRCTELVQESNRANGEPEVAPEALRDFFIDPANNSFFDLMADQLLDEIQVESRVLGVEFLVPPLIADRFESPAPGFLDELVSSDSNEDEEFGESLPVYLYPLDEVSGDHLVQLLDAQQLISDFDEACRLTAAELGTAQRLLALKDDWRTKIASANHEDLEDGLANVVCRAIALCCEADRTLPRIPESLAGLFGPNELDQTRAQIRSTASGQFWTIKRNDEPWVCYWLTEIPEPRPIKPSRSLADDSAVLATALAAAADYARSIESGFAEAFGLARFCLLAPSFVDLASIAAEGFSDLAQENFSHALDLFKGFEVLGWTPQDINGLVAWSLADVFGGMGSWNDLVADDQTRYQSVSAELFRALVRFQESLLESLGTT